MGASNIFAKGATSQLITVALRDSTTGQLKTGVAFGSVTVKYHRQRELPTTVSVVTMTAGTWVSGGWVETSAAGVYQFGIPDDALATGANEVTITFSASGVIDHVKTIALTDANLRDAVALGLSRLDAAVSSRSTYAGSDTEGTTTLLSRITGAVPLASDYTPTRAANLDNLDSAVSTRLAAASYSAPLDESGTRAAVGLSSANLEALLAAIATFIDTEVAAIQAKTDNLPASPASTSDCITAAGVRSAVGLAGATLDADLSAIKGDTTSLLARIPAALFSGITSLARWLGLLAGKTADATTLAELHATTAGATFDNTTDSLQAIRDRGDVAWITGAGGGGGGTGTGAYTLSITVDDGLAALQNATVRLTEGVTALTGTTDANGQVVFAVDAATWSVAITKDGYAFTPTTIAVVASDSATYSMSVVAITPDPDPAKAVVVVTCYDETTAAEQGVEIEVTQTTVPTGSTNAAFDSTPVVKVSNASGVVTFTLWKNASYDIRRSGSTHKLRFTPTADVSSVSSFLGSP